MLQWPTTLTTEQCIVYTHAVQLACMNDKRDRQTTERERERDCKKTQENKHYDLILI
jgi:hypothetical protein